MDSLFQFNADSLDWRLQNIKPITFQERLAQIQVPTQEKVEDPIKKIIQAALNASCMIIVNAASGQWTGSGFHIGNGLIATASHVCPFDLKSQPHSIEITFNGEHIYQAQVLASEPDYDAAVIYSSQIANIIPSVVLADSDTVEVGDICAALGNPDGFLNSCSVGRILNTHQGLGDAAPSAAWASDTILFTCQISQGISGGMLILTSGMVCGIIIGISGQHADVGVGQQTACPSNKLKKLLTTL